MDAAGECAPDLEPLGDDLPPAGLHFVSELRPGLLHDLGEMEDVSARGLMRGKAALPKRVRTSA
jgi:hypothetical protein